MMELFKAMGPNLNCYRFSFDEKLLDEIRDTYTSQVQPYFDAPQNASLFEGGYTKGGEFHVGGGGYFYTSYGAAPLLWISCNEWQSYEKFDHVLETFDVKKEVKAHVDFKDIVRLYCGFFVVGDRCYNENFHVDYRPTANAYTLLTPLFPTEPGHGNLLYKDQSGTTQTYVYKSGEAVVFGEQFTHCTEPYAQTDTPRVLLSLQLGTDKILHWDALKQTIATQSKFLVLPCGHRLGHCQCLDASNSGKSTSRSETREVGRGEAITMAAKSYKAGQHSQAQHVCHELLKVEPAHPVALYLLGSIALIAGDYKSAVSFILKSFEFDPYNGEAFIHLGQAYAALGDNDKAKICFDKCLAMNPDYQSGQFEVDTQAIPPRSMF